MGFQNHRFYATNSWAPNLKRTYKFLYLPNRVCNRIAHDHEDTYKPYKVSTHRQPIPSTDCLWYNLVPKQEINQTIPGIVEELITRNNNNVWKAVPLQKQEQMSLTRQQRQQDEKSCQGIQEEPAKATSTNEKNYWLKQSIVQKVPENAFSIYQWMYDSE